MISLMYIQYDGGLKTEKYNVLSIGSRNGKMVCLLDSFITENDAKKIKTNAKLLNGYTIDNAIKWVRSNIPESYRGYREIYNHKYKVLEQYNFT